MNIFHKMNKIETIVVGRKEIGDIILILGKKRWVQFYSKNVTLINLHKKQFFIKDGDIVITNE